MTEQTGELLQLAAPSLFGEEKPSKRYVGGGAGESPGSEEERSSALLVTPLDSHIPRWLTGR